MCLGSLEKEVDERGVLSPCRLRKVLNFETGDRPNATCSSSFGRGITPSSGLLPRTRFAASTPVTNAFSYDHEPCLVRTRSPAKCTLDRALDFTSGISL